MLVAGYILLAVLIGLAAYAIVHALVEMWRPKGIADCQAFCPFCKSDLVANGNYVGETAHGLTIFDCRACRRESVWDFDAPLPILIKPSPKIGAGAGLSSDDIPDDQEIAK
jgi:hypothetical protein